MSFYKLETEGRHQEYNFTGTGFLFIRCFESVLAEYPTEIALHQHEWHDFVWNSSPGPGPEHCMTLNGVPYSYGDSSLLYVPPFHPHKFQVARPLKIWVIGIDQTQLMRMFARTALSKGLELLFASWHGLKPCIDCLSNPLQREAFSSLLSHKYEPGSLDSLEALHFLVALDRLLKPWKEETVVHAVRDSSKEGLIRSAMQFLEKNYSKPVGAEECAAFLGVARSTLSHQFKNLGYWHRSNPAYAYVCPYCLK